MKTLSAVVVAMFLLGCSQQEKYGEGRSEQNIRQVSPESAPSAASGEAAAIVDLRKPSLADAITVAGFSTTPVPSLEQFVHRYEDTHIKLIFTSDKSLSLFSKTGHLRFDGGGTLETLEVFVRWGETGFTDADAYHFAQELEELMGMPHNKLEKWNALTPEGKQHAELLVNSSQDHKPPRFSYSMHRTFQQTTPWYFIIYINVGVPAGRE